MLMSYLISSFAILSSYDGCRYLYEHFHVTFAWNSLTDLAYIFSIPP